MKENCNPPANYSFAQYGRYIEGWRNSMPWAYKGMSLAYDNWAESRWEEIQDKERLMLAWKEGMGLCAKAYMQDVDTAWRGKSVEDSADFALTIRDTLASLCIMASSVLEEQQTSSKSVLKADLLLAGWHNICRDGNDEWHHPRLPDGGFSLRSAKKIQKLYGIDRMGELNA